MPLAFRSLSHGVVAFGYFNIETDLLLLERLFFFTDRFCRTALELLLPGPEPPPTPRPLPGWRIDDPGRLGHLHAAIAGVDLSGFLGATYRRWPFPPRRDDFRQSPDGHRNRRETETLLAPYAKSLDIPVARGPDGSVTLGGYAFDTPGFRRLVAYVVRGGLPRWRDDTPPPDVAAMIDTLQRNGLVPEPYDPDEGP